MHKIKLAAHERFDLHELTVFKSLCATKASAMAKLASDEDLKSLLYLALSTSQEQLRELAELESLALEEDNQQGRHNKEGM